MSETDAAVAQATAMAAAGIRRLLVLSGDAPWCLRQARRLREQLGGDGLWVGPDSAPEPWCAPGALARLLGREYPLTPSAALMPRPSRPAPAP